MAPIEPILNFKQINETTYFVEAEIDGLVPSKKEGETHEVKNGTADVIIKEQSLDIKADIEVKGKKSSWRYKAYRLPSKIIPAECQWEVGKEVIRITMIKLPEVDQDGNKTYVNWHPLVWGHGLDQYDSSEDEEVEAEGATGLSVADRALRKLPFDIEYGKENVIEVDAKDYDPFANLSSWTT